MSRLKQLEARRRVLIARCEAQRAQLGARLAALDPLALLRGTGAAPGAARLRHPLAWAAALAALLLLGRTRELLTLVLWVRSALSLAGRAAHLVRLITQLRASRAARAAAGTAAAAGPAPSRG
jgi:hypothetical protein